MVCQYQVTPEGGAQEDVIVTTVFEHCGEFEVGVAGVAGKGTIEPFKVTSSLAQVALPFCEPKRYNLKVTEAVKLKLDEGRLIVAVWIKLFEVPVLIFVV